MWAARKNDKRMVQSLLERGADKEATDNVRRATTVLTRRSYIMAIPTQRAVPCRHVQQGFTPLMWAEGHVDTTIALLEVGAATEAKDKVRFAPLAVA